MTIKPKPGSVGGVLERKLEKLLVLGAISAGCDDLTAQAMRNGDEQIILQYHGVVTVWIDFALTRAVQICAERLTSQELWRKLAHDREHFTDTLDRTVRAASIALKLLHGFTDHRPSEHEKRDQELYRMKKENADWSFGQLQIHYNRLHPEDQISDKQAERSYKQELERVHRKMTRALDAAKTHLKARSLPPQELFNARPTPQDVLDILTTK